MKAYLMSIIAAAFLVALLKALGGTGAGQGMLRLVGGILLTLTVFRPLEVLELKLPQTEHFRSDAQAAVSDGLEQAESMRNACITEGVQAYILNKATALGADVHVSVSVNSQHIPFAARITGDVTPEIRKQLAQTLETDLGITKENQSWTG